MNNDYYNEQIDSEWIESKEIYGIKLTQTNNNKINHFQEITKKT